MFRSRVGWYVCFWLALSLVLAACGGEASPTAVVTTAPPVSPTAQAAPKPTEPVVPSPTPLPPTATPSPTAVPTPTATAAPTPTAVLPANDGRWVAYIARDNTLYAGRADGSRKVKLAENAQSVDWSPDGSRIMYYLRGDSLAYVATYEGLNPHQLTTIPGFGKWLPDGKSILLRPATAASRKYTIISDSDGKSIKEFELPEAAGYYSAVFDLTPDAKNVVYYRLPQDTGAPDNFVTSTASRKPTENLGPGVRPAEYHLLNLASQEDKILGDNLSDALAVWNTDYTELVVPNLKDKVIQAISLKSTQARTVARFSGQGVALMKRDVSGKRLYWLNPLSTVALDGSGLRTFQVATADYPSQALPAYYLNIALDGSSVIYAAGNTNEAGGGVFKLDAASGRINKLADNDPYNPTAELFAGASPDNKLIAYTVRTSATGTYSIKDAGSGKQVGQLDGSPVWQPLPVKPS